MVTTKSKAASGFQFKKTREIIKLNSTQTELTGKLNKHSSDWSAWLDQASEFKSMNVSNTSVLNINFPIKWWEN
ncbi:MAG: hypothetical protein K0R26_1357 [Bacteroidota bacterium]|jgi:hypothetical protein|nr:hypothetical protein [Bacteroidota bacterium]